MTEWEGYVDYEVKVYHAVKNLSSELRPYVTIDDIHTIYADMMTRKQITKALDWFIRVGKIVKYDRGKYALSTPNVII